MADGPVLLDIQATQSPDFRGRGTARYVYELALALARRHPLLVGRFLLDPDLPPPAGIEALLATGKVAYAGTAEAIPQSARLLHVLSPFELGVPIERVLPRAVHELGLRYVASAYDLIPLQHPELYLQDPRQRSRYFGRLEVLRAADGLLTISHATSRAVVERLGIDPARVHMIGAGTSSSFQPAGSRDEAHAVAREAVPALEARFVLFPAGSDGRKNVERLISAFGRLPERVRASYQLLLVCQLPELAANHLRHLAALHGVGDRVLLTGYVRDETMLRLYQATDLLCFPSLVEGYGLPVAEALACGAVAIVSDIEPLSDLVDKEARFDPYDPVDIATAIERALSDEGLRDRCRARAAASRTTWDEVADRAAASYEPLIAGRRRPWRRRLRVAVVSPFPPAPSGVAGYTYRLVEELARISDLEIDCFADGLDQTESMATAPDGLRVYDARQLASVDGAVGGYDEILYAVGNSQFHVGALAALRRVPGSVLAHDVRLSGLYRFASTSRTTVPGGLTATIRRVYGPSLPADIASSGAVTAVEAEQYGLLLAREVIGLADRFLVTSEAAARLARVEAGPSLAGRVGVLPFAIEPPLPGGTLDRIVAELPSSARVIASFGIVDPIKQPTRLLAAFAALSGSRPELTLVFVGPVSAELHDELTRLGAELGLADRVVLTGRVDASSYGAWLARADLAVQLRASFSGEASGAVGDCLGSGLPTVVTGIGWMGELPDAVAVKVPAEVSELELATTIGHLLDDESARRALAGAGRAYASAHSFERAARELLAALGAGRRLAWRADD